MAAATAKPPQNIAALNIPKAEWKTVWIIAKWHATGAGIYVLRRQAQSNLGAL